MEGAAAEHPGWAESAQILDFLKILKNHDFRRKIKIAESIGVGRQVSPRAVSRRLRMLWMAHNRPPIDLPTFIFQQKS